MFKKFVTEMVAAQTEQEVTHILYRVKSDSEEWGVDLAYQHEKISWKDHELLFDLAEKFIKGMGGR